jgi:hypothetical protein
MVYYDREFLMAAAIDLRSVLMPADVIPRGFLSPRGVGVDVVVDPGGVAASALTDVVPVRARFPHPHILHLLMYTRS